MYVMQIIALQFKQKHCVAKAIVETSLARINWLVQNFGTRNNLLSVFHQTLTFHVKGQAAPD